MKRICKLFIIFLMLSSISFNQAYSQDNDDTFKLIDANFTLIINSEKQENGDFKISIQQIDDVNKNAEFTVTQLKLLSFIEIFEYKVKSIYPDIPNFSASDQERIKQTAKEFFFRISIESLLESEDEAPIVGKLKIADQVTLCKGPNKDKNCNQGVINIEDVEFEIMDGFIENIKVIGKGTNKAKPTNYIFENKYGIGFSTRGNFRKLESVALYDAIQSDSSYYLQLGDLFDYDYKLLQQSKDYSPKNGVYKSFGGKELELKKEETSKLFDFIVFSDFMGIENDNPNGLVQVEFAKKIPINTIRLQSWGLLSKIGLGQGVGYFQYIKPQLLISKIEENNRYLKPDKDFRISTDSLANKSLSYSLRTTPLDLLAHQNLSLGLDWNIIFLDNPEGKCHAQLDLGFKFGRTLIRDSILSLDDGGSIIKTGITDDFGINYFTLYPTGRIQLFPDARFGMTLSAQLQYFIPAFNNPDLITFAIGGDSHKDYSRWIGSYDIQGFWKPSSMKATVFVRWKFNHQMGNITHNFHQLQTGISFYITNGK